MTETEVKQLAGLWAMYAAYYRVKLDDQDRAVTINVLRNFVMILRTKKLLE